ncbi:MAG: rRNA maturation RNase YbeY [Nitrospiraceae bacterium]
MPVLVRVRCGRSRIRRPSLEKLAQQVLTAVGKSEAELSLELVSDRRIRGLNRHYRGLDVPTDVLAFPMREASGPVNVLLGDIVISLETARRQARAGGHPLREEVTALLIHGVLHLCGYDHEGGERDASRMRRKELEVLKHSRPIPSFIPEQPFRRNGRHK